MKLGFTRSTRFPLSDISSFLRPLRTLKQLNQHLSLAAFPAQKSPLPSQTSLTLQTPLFLHPPNHTSTHTDLQKWYSWAKTLANSVGSTFSNSDNGPDSTILCRELNWLLEDAIHGTDPTLIIHQSGITNPSKKIELKVGIDDLYTLWRQRIEERRPFQYIVGCEHWRDLVLSVQEGVLIPRPETEIIIDLVAELVSKDSKGLNLKEGLWVDLGTGSGAIAIGIARILGASGRVIATDLSPVAVRVASFNVHRYDLQEKIHVREGSWFEPLKDLDLEGRIDGLVSNPPYIPSEDISGLQAEVGRHEPRLALDGGNDGMDDLLHLCNGAASMLKPNGFFAFETNGEKQCKFLVHYIENKFKSSFRDINVVSDFAGIRRFITGFRR